MSTYKKFGIEFVSYIFLGWFVCQPLIDIGRYKPYFEMPENGHKISHSELNAFLDIWAKMMQTSFRDKFTSKSLKDHNKYPKSLETWLRLQYWNIDRFFYDEQRIRDLLEYVTTKNQLDDNKKIAKNSGVNLNAINLVLEQRLYATTYDADELTLIEANQYQITEILDGRAIMGK